MPYTIPIGPYHPALEEPYKINITCQGENVQDVDIAIGFNFRSIELLAQRRNYIQDIPLVERVCGICSGVHTMTFCMAAEAIAGIELPARAGYIRVIVAELERLHSHLLWCGVAAELIGFQTMFMELFALRETVMDVLEAISGNRVNYAMNCIGGVNRDVKDPESILSAVRKIKQGVEKVAIPIFTTDATVKARTAGVGVLTRADALAYGTVGPTARASGLELDLRCDLPYAAYGELGVNRIVQTDGDVRARVVVRALEMLESIRLIEKALQTLPSGPIRIADRFPVIPAGEATARAEAPRGEVFYYIASDGSDVPQRVKIRTPTYANMPSVRAMSKGQHLADMPLIQASIDPCYSCTDR
ncbi:Ni,Fe-hydrogenase III large subunit [Longilinea arvoryzae]|uniref:Ni,Fe-hydrogenase III large subunit n=1 Tax=Longilinea arvoryzae TaxID=360412 RepID=A0A0S7BIN7_9CHLR|nr:nickel-dependent hydrogenase large subunit [Longilinea arvoryzae]GAP13653.1 Ni,Fe-hydrogenase III large subunit [Longilinea arvoryzae]